MSDPEKETGKEQAKAEIKGAPSQQGDWWDGFARAVEDPEISTYDYLKNSFLKSFELDGAQGTKEFLNKAQKKAVKELADLTDLRELRATLKRLESNRLLFNAQTRVIIQSTGVLLDIFLAARDEYEAEVAKRVAAGGQAPSEEERKREIDRIVEKKLAEPGVADSAAKVAHVLTGRDQEDIKKTLIHASQELRERSTLSRVTNDAIGISKKYFTLDNAITVGINVLPLITWQYRWAIAAVIGVYVSRKTAYHGYKAVRARVGGDKETAREEGVKALAALKAAGGNVLSIGISPLVGKLPGVAASAASFAAGQIYNVSITVSQKLLQKREEVREKGFKAGLKSGWKGIREFFTTNQDSLATLAVEAVTQQSPSSETAKTVQGASKRVRFSSVTRVGRGLWVVGGALTRRFNRAALDMLDTVCARKDVSVSKSLNDAAQGAPVNDNAAESADTSGETKPDTKPSACGPA